ncbi:MAG: aspartate/glutamate racemase family protein, partial [Betaproteobacteria bacterium]
MKTLGILGGMSWESSAVYYRLLNQAVAARRGGLHSASLVLASVDFETVAERQRTGDWAGAAAQLGRAGAGLRAAGAQALLIATNTMHKVADEVAAMAGLPLLHIADATGAAMRAAGVRRAAFLGTRFSMEDRSIVIDRLERHGTPVLVPEPDDRVLMHRVIFDELC